MIKTEIKRNKNGTATVTYKAAVYGEDWSLLIVKDFPTAAAAADAVDKMAKADFGRCAEVIDTGVPGLWVHKKGATA